MGPIKAGQLSFFSQVPRTKTYPAVKELERKGLVSITPGKPELYSARSPTEVLMPIVTRLDHDVKACEQVVQSLAMAYESRKYMKHDTPKQSEQFWEMQGRQGIVSRLNQLMKDASTSISYSATANGLVRAYKTQSDTLEQAAKRGARVRLLSPVTAENSTLVKEFGEIVNVKPTKESLGNFVCLDGKELVVIDSRPDDERTDKGADIALWTTNPLLVKLFETLFEEIWRHNSSTQNNTS
jgi:sugar-specific transcriptional regulator TrmB